MGRRMQQERKYDRRAEQPLPNLAPQTNVKFLTCGFVLEIWTIKTLCDWKKRKKYRQNYTLLKRTMNLKSFFDRTAHQLNSLGVDRTKYFS